MKIDLAKSAGFCFGVRRALTIALATAQKKTPVVMLGDIVHNEDVVRRINRAGIRKIDTLSKAARATLLIRAHGAGKRIFDRARALGFTIVDATCPMVKEIHRIAQAMEKKRYQIIIIGDKKHDEVRGITGQLTGSSVVIDAQGAIPWKAIDTARPTAVLCQSTQNLEKVTRILEALRARIRRLEFFNTICSPTRIKQQEIKTMPLTHDVMVIIGSRSSANTRRLFEISKSLNPKSHWIANARELKTSWFAGASRIGISSGSSTPDETTQEVVRAIKNYFS